jgi:ABC-type tungstate transport system substrate-binding protein
MTMRRALQVVLVISVIGIVFSGILTYRELCSAAGGGCPAVGASGTILGYPACLYGLVMYLLLAATAALGLRAKE